MLLKNKAFIVFIIIIVLAAIVYFVLDFGLSGCLNCRTGITGGEEENLTDEVEYEQVIAVNPGEDITITLESNPSTGYSWQFVYDSGKLEFVKRDFIAPEEEEPELVGAPVDEVFVFRALEPGETEISFLYARPWETEVEPEKEAYYKVVIGE